MLHIISYVVQYTIPYAVYHTLHCIPYLILRNTSCYSLHNYHAGPKLFWLLSNEFFVPVNSLVLFHLLAAFLVILVLVHIFYITCLEIDDKIMY